MSTDNRIHVFLWNTIEGIFTGMTLGQEENVSAMADSPKAVLKQIREWAEEIAMNQPWKLNFDLSNPRQSHVVTKVRPEIRIRGKMQPYSDQLTMKFPCVLLDDGPGLVLVSCPTLDIEFSLTDESELSGLGSHLLASQLSGKPIAEIMSFGGALHGHIEGLTLKRSGKQRKKDPFNLDSHEGQALRHICEPLLTKRRGLSFETAAFGRDDEVARLTGILQKEGSSLILVGESGVGKSTILKQAVKKLSRTPVNKEEDNAQPNLDPINSRERFWVSNGSRIIAGMKYLGEWEQRCESLIADLNQISGVLCLESLLEIIRIGGQSPDSSVAAFFQPYVQRGDLRVLCEATPIELDRAKRLLPGFVGLFQIVKIQELETARAIPVLEKICESLTASQQVDFESGVPRLVYHLFRRFQSYAAFPGPAVRFIRSLLQRSEVKNSRTISRSLVHEEFSRLTGLPPILVRDDMPMEIGSVRQQLRSVVHGQDRAVDTLSEVVLKLKAGLNDPRRPLGVFLFCGPTGVGKTALAKALADYLFGQGKDPDSQITADRETLIRMDMSEYNHPGAARRLLESLDGSPSAFIKKVRQNPFSVVLLDEIEKADEEVFDLLLNVLDEGFVTDPLGRVAYFRSSIILLTSNIGAQSGARAGFESPQFPDFEAEVLKFFRPEFFNRLDGVIAFDPLTKPVIRTIANLELQKLMSRPGLQNRSIRLQFDQAIIDWVAQTGFDAKYGARPLLRRIEESVSIPLSKWLLAHPTLDHITIHVRFDLTSQVSFELNPPEDTQKNPIPSPILS